MMYAQMVTTMGLRGSLIHALAPKKIMAQAFAHARSTRDKVDRRLARKSGAEARPDIVAGIMDKIDQPGGITLNELYADSQILLMAGSETGATLLAVALYYLLRNPDKLARLREEVRGSGLVFTSGRAADGSVDDETNTTTTTTTTTTEGAGSGGYASVQKLPYLMAVINESLRIHPSLPAGINRFVPKGGAVIDGQFVAEGTILQVPHWAAFHLEENFADPWDFVPERWLEPCPERYLGDKREVFQPFSYGKRNCIGRGLALMETRICLARLVLDFDMELMGDSEDWNKQRVYLLYEKRPLNVRLVEAGKGEQL